MRITLPLWLSLNENKEGRTPFMYEDVKGYMTTGVGNILPLALALTLAWRVGSQTGRFATQEEIRTEYARMKALPLEKAGGFAYEPYAMLFLDNDTLDRLVQGKLRSVYTQLKLRVPDLDTWPLDAEVALTSMAWAMGEGRIFGGEFPKFNAHIKRKNFAEYALRDGKVELVSGAAFECKMTEKGNPGIIPRNVMNRIMFQNAHEVMRRGLDKNRLYYPTNLSATEPGPERCPTCGR